MELMRKARIARFQLGYTEMPKTIDRLMTVAASQRKEKTGAELAIAAFCTAT